jgi:hypothetical protein
MRDAPETLSAREQSRLATERPAARLLVLAVFGASIAVVLVAGLLAASGTAGALLAFPIPNATAILPDATATPSGHNVVVDGTTACTEGEIVEVRAVVTQASTGAEATGTVRARCVGVDTIQGWTIHAATRGSTAFESGDAHVDAWAETRSRGEVTDTLQWERDVTIELR